MSQQFFTAEEMEALRNDLQSPQSREVETVDLVSGDHSFRKNVPIIERRLEVFANTVQGNVMRVLRQTCDAKFSPAETVGPRTAQGLMRDLVFVTEMRAPNGTLYGFMGLESSVSFLMIERIFGAPITSGDSDIDIFQPPSRDSLTPIEQKTLLPILQEMAGEFCRRVFDDESGTAMTVDEISTGLPPEVPADVETTMIWRLIFSLNEEVDSSLVLVILPSLLERVVRGDQAGTRKPRPDWLHAHLAKTWVKVSGELGLVDLSVGELLKLKPGDVLRLDRGQADPIDIKIENKKKLEGIPVQRNGAYCVQVGTELLAS